jgi:hypothetical protein
MTTWGFCIVAGLAVASKTAGLWEVGEGARGLDIGKETGNFVVNPWDEVLVVGFVGGNVPFSNVVGSAGAVDSMDARLFEKEVWEGFVDLVDLNGVLHLVPAEARNRYVAVVFHILVLFAKELEVGLGILAAKGEGDKEVVMDG